MNNNKILVFLSFLTIIISGMLLYNSYFNFIEVADVQSIYTTNNKELKNEIQKKSDSLTEIQTKIDSAETDYKELTDYSQIFSSVDYNLDKTNLTDMYSKYLISEYPVQFDLSLISSLSEKEDRYRKLMATFFGDTEVDDFVEANGNIIIGNLFFNDYALDYLTLKIIENNNKIYKKIGLVEYYDLTTNFLTKYKIINSLNIETELSEVTGGTKDVISLKSYTRDSYDLLMRPSDLNIQYLNTINSTIETEKVNTAYSSLESDSSLEDEIQKINRAEILNIDIYSQNVDYLESFNIFDKTLELSDEVQVLRYLVDSRNRIYMLEERKNGKATKIIYYDSSGKPFYELEFLDYRTFYFELNKSSESITKYNEAIELYNKFL